MKLKSLTTTPDELLPNIHPCEILQEEFLVPMNISAYRLAKETCYEILLTFPIFDIIHHKRIITAETALRFSHFLGTIANFGLNLLNAFDIEEEQRNHIG